MNISRTAISLNVADVDASARFAKTHFGFEEAMAADGFVSLQFVRAQTQSRMVAGDPARLLIDYTRTMFAALLWRPAPRVLGMVGLGGGSQVKFAHAHLPGTRIEVVENNLHVVALRRDFGIPDDDARLAVVVPVARSTSTSGTSKPDGFPVASTVASVTLASEH